MQGSNLRPLPCEIFQGYFRINTLKKHVFYKQYFTLLHVTVVTYEFPT
jgi:hypothetical protein